MSAARLACLTALLGPALLLGMDPVWWGLLLLLLPLNSLALAATGCRLSLDSRCAAWLPPLLLLLLPLQLVLVERACRITGLAPELPVLELCLTLLAHTGSFLLLLGRLPLTTRERRRMGVRAACWLPLPLAGLILIGCLDGLLASLAHWAGADPTLAGSGLARVLLAALALAWLQRSRPGAGGMELDDLAGGGRP